MNSWTKKQYITYLILLLVLVIDFTQSFLVLIKESDFVKSIGVWTAVLYTALVIGGTPLIGFVVWLNQDRLQKLNIDKIYIIFLIFSGLLALSLFRYNCFAIIGIVYFVYILFNRKIKFSLIEQSSYKTILFAVGGFIVLIAAVLLLINNESLNSIVVNQKVDRFFFEAIPISIFQEAIFRGILFMYLKDINLNDSRILFVSTILFWITHIHYLAEPSALAFWVVIPAVGLLFGYVALRSKSIAVSSIVHIFYNAFSSMLSLIW